jgi:hypothetical protein
MLIFTGKKVVLIPLFSIEALFGKSWYSDHGSCLEIKGIMVRIQAVPK